MRAGGLLPWMAFALALGSAPAVWSQDEQPTAEQPDPSAEALPEDEPPPDDEVENAIDPEIFTEALSDFESESYVDAAAGFWGYIHFGQPTDEDYEWAQYFLAESMRELGFYHAAVFYYTVVAKTRSRPEILPHALRKLEQLTRERPYSQELVDEDLLYDSEFGALPDELNLWVNFVQGYYNYRNDLIRWGEHHFAKVPKNTYYGARARYVRGVHALRKKKDDKASAMFLAIIESEAEAPDIKNKAHLAMARLFFDTRRYEEALGHYNQVEQINLSFEQAHLLLEKAWCFFYLGRHRKAMGLLHALDAPSYRDFTLPDIYVLRALILKDLCHYILAKKAVRGYRHAYVDTLDELHRRVPMELSHRILEGATQEGTIQRRTAFLRALEAERRAVEDHDSAWEDVELDQHLRRMYDFEIREQTRLWRIDFDTSADAVALALLESEEQLNLLDYEIGLDIFKRLKVADSVTLPAERLVIPYDSRNVYYEFEGEFWNDELHSYKYYIESRCLGVGMRE